MAKAERARATVDVDWVVSGRMLRQRAAVLAEVGAALEAAGQAGTAGMLADLLEQGVGRALTGSGGGDGLEATAAEATAAGRGARTQAPGSAQALREVCERDLAKGSWPVVWVGSAGREGWDVTLAVALGEDGVRQVVGLWPGIQTQVGMARKIAWDLWHRGLNRKDGWLAITLCGQALLQALQDQWGGGVRLGHDQKGVCRAVLAHLPEGERTSAEDALRQAWDLPTVGAARQALTTLSHGWAGQYPGAADRLTGEIEATTLTQAMGVHGALALRLRTTAPAAYLLERSLATARGQTGTGRLEAIAADLLRRQARFRQLPASERNGLGTLMQHLQGASG